MTRKLIPLCVWYYKNCCRKKNMEQNTKENLCEETCVAVFYTIRCSTGSQCNFLSTGLMLVYLLVFDTILAVLFWMHCNLRRLNLGEAPE